MASLTYSDVEQTYEVDLRMFMDDFLVVVGALPPDTNPFGNITITPSKSEIKKYLSAHFLIYFDEIPVELKINKIKIEELTIAVNFSFKHESDPEGISSIKIIDSIYVDEFINQRNIIHINLPGKKRKSLLFNQFNKEQTATW